jgi:hypothetical protein
MLKHLPIVLLAAFPAAHAADKIPDLDMARECRFEGSVLGNEQQCIQDEKVAREQLQKEWGQFSAGDKRQCQNAATMAGTASYVELVTCLEMARDVRNPGTSNSQSQTVGRSRK